MEYFSSFINIYFYHRFYYPYNFWMSYTHRMMVINRELFLEKEYCRFFCRICKIYITDYVFIKTQIYGKTLVSWNYVCLQCKTKNVCRGNYIF